MRRGIAGFLDTWLSQVVSRRAMRLGGTAQDADGVEGACSQGDALVGEDLDLAVAIGRDPAGAVVLGGHGEGDALDDHLVVVVDATGVDELSSLHVVLLRLYVVGWKCVRTQVMNLASR